MSHRTVLRFAAGHAPYYNSRTNVTWFASNDVEMLPETAVLTLIFHGIVIHHGMLSKLKFQIK